MKGRNPRINLIFVSVITSSLPESKPIKKIRSYVLRQGRITAAQEKAFRDHWSEYGIDYQPRPMDLDQVFGRHAPRVLEIGSGDGDNILQLAIGHPEDDHIAVEVHRPGAGRLINAAVKHKLHNLRVVCHDAVEVMQNQVGDRSLEKVLIFFPDPWPKKRHHKRRLIQPGFIKLLASRLAEHGRLYVATDWGDLAEHVLQVCDNSAEIINLAGKGNFSPRPAWRVPTKFERRGEHLSHEVWDLAFALR